MGETAPDVGRVLDEYEALWNVDDSKLDVVVPDVAVYDPAAPDGELHEDCLYYNEREVFAQFGLTPRGLLPLAPKLLWGNSPASGDRDGSNSVALSSGARRWSVT